ncbi:MAG: extracellular solute-binding protein [Clostridia bacterium]|nr:extracellular solute-binding protein [Clostridia bacterium]
MQSKFLRIMAMLLALMMVFGTLALTSCADDSEDTDGDKQPGTENSGDEGNDPVEDEEPRIPLDYLPTTTYGGETVNILEWTVAGQTPGMAWVPWEEIDVDAGDGDPINNAIYDRNGVVEETYDVEITKEYLSVDGSPQYVTAFRANESSGDQAYQMITLRTTTIAPLVQEGLMTNMYELENLHTDMPWWNQDSVRSYTMGSALYCAAPEMLLRDKGATAAMFYNQKIATDHEITDLYELAENGDWTMDIMIEYAEKVTIDMNGDDIANSIEDQFGLWGNGRDMLYHLFAGAGLKFAEIDDEGYLQLNIGNDETIMVWQDILDLVVYTDFYSNNAMKGVEMPEGFDLFVSDGCLFRIDMVKDVLDLRNMESMYGVLPVPKYDEYQDNYSSLVWMHHDSVLSIPGSVTNLDVVSTVLEHMSYISYYDVYPIFYDTIILGKSARDEQSKEMLELIFQTRSFDPGQYWLTAELHGGSGFLTIFENGKTNISSLWASLTTMTESAVEEFNEMIDDIG